MQLFNVLSVSLFAMAIGLSPLSVAGEAIEPTIPDPWPSIQVSTMDYFSLQVDERFDKRGRDLFSVADSLPYLFLCAVWRC